MIARKAYPSQDQIREVLSYDPLTGEFKWKISLSGGRGAGEFAGSFEKNTGYLRIQFGKRRYLSHVLAWIYMTGEIPEQTIDHEDRNRSNNRWANLRLATPTEQARNRNLYKNNTTGTKGIYSRDGKWRVMIRIDGKLKHLGTYDDLNEAIQVRKYAAKQHFKEFQNG